MKFKVGDYIFFNSPADPATFTRGPYEVTKIHDNGIIEFYMGNNIGTGAWQSDRCILAEEYMNQITLKKALGVEDV